MTDQELLDLAAKAGKIRPEYRHELAGEAFWNPLTNDGDALRLAVKLGFHVCIDKPPVIEEPYTHVIGFIGTSSHMQDAIEYHNDDPYAATRRAIVIVAAAIGKATNGTD